MTRVGIGFDSHPLVPGRPLILGGVPIEHPLGLQGHSDADALCHALTDALLGAAGLGDIGAHFPPEDPRYRDADSLNLLREAYTWVQASGLRLSNADATIYADAPRLGPYREAMRRTLATALGIPLERVNVKFKTLEGLGPFAGTQAIAVHAIVALEPADAGDH
ncbi:MAG: 2-C-methyl-D-erythritol 2,4-cyclodiphosphate synthase [Chloroflexi bacterium]|nr:2-C-methyl-D-erythritol 2,4-cyclodiphosphate synthase [Chloroflexota bacterium]